MTKEKKGTIRGAGRVGFLARQDGIKTMLEAGHPLLAIYQRYEKDMSISYSQFVKYVHKFIRSKPNEGEKTTKAVETKTTKPGEKEKRKIPFVHDANAGNSDEFIK